MLVVLVGPKGSGKSHIGRTLERTLGVRFFHVEPLWMEYYAGCQAVGSQPDILEGIAKVHPRVADALSTHRHVCVETTGASPEILDSLLSLAPRQETLIVRVSAPLQICLHRIASRDATNQIPVDSETVESLFALSNSAPVAVDLTLENVGLSEAAITESFRHALAR